MRVLGEGSIDVHYGFVALHARDDDPPPLDVARTGQRNGLCGARVPGGLSMVTGLHTGEVPFRIEWHATEPEVGAEWQDVVEVPLILAGTALTLGAFEEFQDVDVPVAGPHRARYCARRMDEGRELDTPDEDQDAPDAYLLQLWPSEDGSEQIVREGSDLARYWHAVARGEAR